MSVLTEVVLYVATVSNKSMDEKILTLEFGSDRRSGQRFSRINEDRAGGSKVFCDQIYGACFNYVGPDEIKEKLAAVDWGYWEAVAIINHENSDEEMEVWRNNANREN